MLWLNPIRSRNASRQESERAWAAPCGALSPSGPSPEIWRLLPLPDDSKSAAARADTGTSGSFAARVDFADYDIREHIQHFEIALGGDVTLKEVKRAAPVLGKPLRTVNGRGVELNGSQPETPLVGVFETPA